MTISPQFLEAVNGTALVMLLCVAFVFAGYIVSKVKEFGFNCIAYRESEAAIAMMILVLGEAIIRAPVWYVRHMENTGHSTKALAGVATFIVFTGLVTVIVGGICVIRNVMPNELHPWPSLIAVISALVFGVGMAL